MNVTQSPVVRGMINLTKLTSMVKSFSAAFCLRQISAALSEMSEANKDLLEKYRKEVALRRKYHEQLVELKGMQGRQNENHCRTENLCH